MEIINYSFHSNPLSAKKQHHISTQNAILRVNATFVERALIFG
jgi:hypothetical protein